MVKCPTAGYNAAVMASPITGSKRSAYGTILVLLVILLLLAYALRLFNLDAFSFWTDEGLTPLRSGYPIREILSNRITIQEGITRDTHPPLYYLIIHFTHQLFGESDFAYRYPSLMAGVLLVPLLFQFGRRLQTTLAGLIAALFTAVNPLQVYYGNEARMYTIFVLLAAAATYVLWRALTGANLRRSLLLYILLAGLAIYTHYTAVFLIAVQGLFWIGILWREGHKRLIGGLGILALLLAIPIVPYTVPRIFTGAEADYFYVPPTVILMDVLRFFSLGLTADYKEAFVSVLLLAIFILAMVGFWSAGSWLKRLYLLAYLLAVPVGLMAGSLIKPMYQGVRHIMVGSPAFLLILALGAGYLLQAGRQSAGSRRIATRLVGIALFMAPLLGSVYALNNLYNNQAYAKDDLRSMIRYVERRAGGDDVVLYNNAILLPLHKHYQTRQDLPVTALPIYPHAADGVESQLAELAAGVERIWFVTDPPADDRDADGRVPGWLADNLQDIDNETFHARTTVVHSTGYRTAPNNAQLLPPDGRSVDIEWPGLPAVQGMTTGAGQHTGVGTLWVDLFWEGATAIPPSDTTIRLWLEDAHGEDWAVYEQALSDNFSSWPAVDLVRESYKIPLPQAMPPGIYGLMAQPLDGDGQPMGEAQSLHAVEIAPSPGLEGRPAVVFENGLALQHIAWFDDSVHPGHNMSMALIWQAEPGKNPPLDDLRYELQVLGLGGDVLRGQSGAINESGLDHLPDGTAVLEPAAVYFPPDTPPGQYRLRWQLHAGDEPVGARPSWRPWHSDSVDFGSITVAPWPLETSLPAGIDNINAQFGPAIQLAGYELGDPGAALPITLYWLAAEKPAESYLVFIHLVDAETGEIVAQIDRIPVDDLRPTSGWREGEVLTDKLALALAADLPPGEYQLNVGVYNPESGERLPLTIEGERLFNDQLTLDSVTLPRGD